MNISRKTLFSWLLLTALGQNGHARLSSSSTNSNMLQEDKHESARARQLDVNEPLFQEDNPHDPFSSTIKNNVQWRDQNGDIMEIGRGGKITKIEGVYYWVGHNPAPKGLLQDGGDIFLYKSMNLGSNSWELVKKIHEFQGTDSGGNCDLNQHPGYSNKKYFIICKRRFFMETFDEKPIEEAEFIPLMIPEDPVETDYPNYKWGSSETFQDGDDMYYITSRKLDEAGAGSTRSVFVYRLDQTWSKLEELYAIWSWPHREGLHMVKNGDFYYIFASQTAGWKDSRTWYRKATTIKGLADVTEEEVVFYPANTSAIKSHGSQSRMFFEVDNGIWLFSGNRYPNEHPAEWDLRFGRAVQAPVKFTSNSVEVYFKREFDWKTYNFNSGDYDSHPLPDTGYVSLFETKVSVEDSSIAYGGTASLKYCDGTNTMMLENVYGSGYATYTTYAGCTGKFALHISYLTATDNFLHVSVNGKEATTFNFGSSGSSCEEGGSSYVRTIEVELLEGVNVIAFNNPSEMSPLIEWISVVPVQCMMKSSRKNNDFFIPVDDVSVAYADPANIISCKGTTTNMMRNIHGEGYMTFSVNLQCPTVNVDVSYLTAANRKMYISVNGGNNQIFDFEATGKWCGKRGKSKVQPLPLTGFKEGLNTITFQNPGDDPETATNELEPSPLIEWLMIKENCFLTSKQ